MRCFSPGSMFCFVVVFGLAECDLIEALLVCNFGLSLGAINESRHNPTDGRCYKIAVVGKEKHRTEHNVEFSFFQKCKQVRERSSKSISMSRPSRSSLSASTPDSLSDNESSLGTPGRFQTPSRKTSVPIRYETHPSSFRSIILTIVYYYLQISDDPRWIESKLETQLPAGKPCRIETTVPSRIDTVVG